MLKVYFKIPLLALILRFLFVYAIEHHEDDFILVSSLVSVSITASFTCSSKLKTKRSDGGVVVDVETICVEGDHECGGKFGNLVRIQHSNGLETVYAHLSTVNVRRGSKVDKGQEIALSGNTGRSTGDHLHFEVRKGSGWAGNDVNPYDYLR
ncbi:MAG: M23 family metallopeptidase [Acaryochloris sp. CRU_2_0]|nr:M23 family metallopeptidase [Acaryochloris sp. CRU_2_0]